MIINQNLLVNKARFNYIKEKQEKILELDMKNKGEVLELEIEFRLYKINLVPKESKKLENFLCDLELLTKVAKGRKILEEKNKITQFINRLINDLIKNNCVLILIDKIDRYILIKIEECKKEIFKVL